MAIHYLIIEKESEEQTLESVKLLPEHVQRQIALFDVPASELANIINSAHRYEQVSNVVPKENAEMLAKWSEDILQAFYNPNNFIVTYDDLIYPIIVGNVVNSSVEINGECTMHIVGTDEGYSVDLYSTKELMKEHDMSDDIVDPVASTWVSYAELDGEED